MSKCTQNCGDGRRPLDSLLDGDLSQKQLVDVETHVEACEDCSETKQILDAAYGAWKNQQSLRMPRALRDQIEERLFAAIEAETDLPQRSVNITQEVPRRRLVFVLAFIAAAAVLLLALYTTLHFSEKVPTTLIMARSPEQTGKAPFDKKEPSFTATVIHIHGGLASYEKKGETVKPVVSKQVFKLDEVMTLGDGASVRVAIEEFAVVVLRDGAVFELVSGDGVKGIFLKRGSAALDVNSDALDNVFVVKTPAGDVEVKGTVFYVGVSSSAELTVAVAESTVTVRDLANPRNVIPVHSGQEIEVDWSNPEIKSMDSNLEQKIHGMLTISGHETGYAGIPVEEKRPSKKVRRKESLERVDAEELFAKATEARKGGNVQVAAELYRSIIKRGTQSEYRAEAAFNLGQLYFTVGNINKAESVLTSHSTLIETSSFRDMSLFYLAKAKCRLEKYNEAKEVIVAFLERSPNHPLAASMRKLQDGCRP